MRLDTIFRIYSMSKAITTAAALTRTPSGIQPAGSASTAGEAQPQRITGPARRTK
jgi:hypothetical protein